MWTRPRRSHHRPLKMYFDTQVCRRQKTVPPTIAAALQSNPGRVWTPVLVRDHAVAIRLRESVSYAIDPRPLVLLFLLVLGAFWWSSPGLAFPGSSCRVVGVRVCAVRCVCVPVVPFAGPWWPFFALFLGCWCCCGCPVSWSFSEI